MKKTQTNNYKLRSRANNKTSIKVLRVTTMWRWLQYLPTTGIYSKDCGNTDSCILKTVFPIGHHQRRFLCPNKACKQLSFNLEEAKITASPTLWHPIESRSTTPHMHQPSCRSASWTCASPPTSLHQSGLDETATPRTMWEMELPEMGYWPQMVITDQKPSTPNVMGLSVFHSWKPYSQFQQYS